jgi:hypothetical protein
MVPYYYSKEWNVKVKGIYQLPSRIRIELLHSNIWWADGMEPLNKGFTYAKSLNICRKGIQ